MFLEKYMPKAPIFESTQDEGIWDDFTVDTGIFATEFNQLLKQAKESKNTLAFLNTMSEENFRNFIQVMCEILKKKIKTFSELQQFMASEQFWNMKLLSFMTQSLFNINYSKALDNAGITHLELATINTLVDNMVKNGDMDVFKTNGGKVRFSGKGIADVPNDAWANSTVRVFFYKLADKDLATPILNMIKVIEPGASNDISSEYVKQILEFEPLQVPDEYPKINIQHMPLNAMAWYIEQLSPQEIKTIQSQFVSGTFSPIPFPLQLKSVFQQRQKKILARVNKEFKVISASIHKSIEGFKKFGYDLTKPDELEKALNTRLEKAIIKRIQSSSELVLDSLKTYLSYHKSFGVTVSRSGYNLTS